MSKISRETEVLIHKAVSGLALFLAVYCQVVA